MFMEEHPYSINDGAFGNVCTGAQPTNAPADAQIIDYPATHHNGAGSLSFAGSSGILWGIFIGHFEMMGTKTEELLEWNS